MGISLALRIELEWFVSNIERQPAMSSGKTDDRAPDSNGQHERRREWLALALLGRLAALGFTVAVIVVLLFLLLVIRGLSSKRLVR